MIAWLELRPFPAVRPRAARWLLRRDSGSAGALAVPAQVTRSASAFGLAPLASTPHPSSHQSVTPSRSSTAAGSPTTQRASRLATSRTTPQRRSRPAPSRCDPPARGVGGRELVVDDPRQDGEDAGHVGAPAAVHTVASAGMSTTAPLATTTTMGAAMQAARRRSEPIIHHRAPVDAVGQHAAERAEGRSRQHPGGGGDP